MAQTCLQCSGSFNDSAQFCPGCGYASPPSDALPVETATVQANVDVSRPRDSLSFTNPNSLMLAFVVFAGMVTVGLGMNGSKSTCPTAWKPVTPAVATPPKPDPAENLRAVFDEVATSVAPVAIHASLIPHDLLDRERMEHMIRGRLENQLGDGWTVEATCYAGWCHIKLIHSIGEIWIDADEGIAEKSVYLN